MHPREYQGTTETEKLFHLKKGNKEYEKNFHERENGNRRCWNLTEKSSQNKLSLRNLFRVEIYNFSQFMEKHRYFSQFYKYQYPKGEKKNTVSGTVVDYIKKFIAYRIRKSKVFAWDRNSYSPMLSHPWVRKKKKLFT